MTPDRTNDTPGLPAALVGLIHAEYGHLTPRQRVEGVQVLSAAVSRERRTSWYRLPRRFAVALVVCVGLVGATKLMVDRERALSYAVEGGHVDGVGHIEPDLARAPKVSFSDGSEVLLSLGTKATLRSVDRHGARVSVADGSAHVDIVHQTGTHWLVDAGPFVITVTGTAFTVGWNTSNEELDVNMERGTVEVNGPLSDGAIVLRSGQHLIIRVRQRETLIRDGAEEAPSVAAPQPPLPQVNAPEEAPTGSPDSSSDPERTVRAARKSGIRSGYEANWASELVSGNFEDIVRQAQHRGVDACLAELSSGGLAILADAARYGRHDDIARQALLAQRRRFPFSTAARDATFLLGRLEETARNPSRAIDWYERYLGEAPDGTYASEAFGRKMNLYEQLYGDERTQPVAKEYLSRFPQGTYAARARTLTHEQ